MDYMVTKERGVGGRTYACYNGAGEDLLKGQPVMRKYGLDYVGAVQHTVPGVGLGEFAGVLGRKLPGVVPGAPLGDISSAALVESGEVRATVYVHATPANYVPGAQLAPAWDETNGAYFREVSYQTGITLLQDWSAKNANTLYSEDTGLGAWIEIAPQASCRNGALHYAWPGLLAADADYYLDGQATSTSATTVTSFLQDRPDFPRNVTVTTGGTTTDVAAGNVVVTGEDIYGNTITESLAITQDQAGATAGTKAFWKITQVVIHAQDGAGATFDVGFGVLIGLGRHFGPAPCVLQAKAAGTVEGTAPTLARDIDEICKNTISFNSAPNNGLREVWILPN